MSTVSNVNSFKELFDLWMKKHRSEGKNRFIIDGIVNPTIWNETKPKVCFLLKESYISPEEYEQDMLLPDHNLARRHWNAYISNQDGYYVYDMPTHQREHAPWFMWCRVENWVKRLFGLLDVDSDNPIQNIAVLDIKKSEGKSSSDYEDILNYAKNDRDLIRKELELIDPDIIICGATYDYCVKAKLFDQLQEVATLKDFGNRKVARDGKRIILDCYHPSASISYDKMELFFRSALESVHPS